MAPLFTRGVNAFADMTQQEFSQRYGTSGLRVPTSGVKVFQEEQTEKRRLKMDSKVPESIDWRKSKAVSEPKDQDKCECCWAFATVSILESYDYI